jgi:hypothetical protein
MWKNRKIGDLSVFERGQIVGARSAGTSVTKTAVLLGVQRATVSDVISPNMNHEGTSAKRHSGWKSTLPQRDRRILRRTASKITELLQHRWQAFRTEYIFFLKVLYPQKLSDASITNPTSIVVLLLLNLWLLNNAQMSKQWCHDYKNLDIRKLGKRSCNGQMFPT